MKYKILSSNALETLEAQVNEYIEKGFEPYGSICSHIDLNCGRCVFQPMLKRYSNQSLDHDTKSSGD